MVLVSDSRRLMNGWDVLSVVAVPENTLFPKTVSFGSSGWVALVLHLLVTKLCVSFVYLVCLPVFV